jgi:hypothetical protein
MILLTKFEIGSQSIIGIQMNKETKDAGRGAKQLCCVKRKLGEWLHNFWGHRSNPFLGVSFLRGYKETLA